MPTAPVVRAPNRSSRGRKAATPHPYRGQWDLLTAAQQAEAQQLAEAGRENRYWGPLLASAVLPPLPPPTAAELRSQLISIDREIAALERGRAALRAELAQLNTITL